MSNRTVVIILSLAVVMMAFILFFERDTMTTDQRMGRKNRVFVKYVQEQVEGLSLRNTNGEEIVIERRGESTDTSQPKWHLTAPRELPADKDQVTAVLSALDYLMRERTVSGKEVAGEAKYGLKTPRLKGAFTIRGRTTGFAIGADAPGEKIYLGLDDRPDELYAVDRSFFKSMDKELGELRSKQILSRSLKNAERITRAGEPSGLSLRRSAQSPWQVQVEGSWIRAAGDRVEALFSTLENLRATRFIADDVKPSALDQYGFKPKSRGVTLGFAGEQELTVLIGDPCPGSPHQVHVALKEGGTVSCVDDEFLKDVERPVDQFPELRTAVFREDSLDGLAIERGGNTLSLKREEGQWRLVDDETPLEQEVVHQLLHLLSDTRAKSIHVGAEAVEALGSPLAKITLTDEEGDLVLSLHRDEKNQALAVRRGDEPVVLAVDPEFAEPIQADLLAFRARKIPLGEAYDMEYLSITGPTRQTLEKSDGLWRLVAPVKTNADTTAVNKLADLMAELAVVRFVAPAAKKEHGLADPAWRIVARMVKDTADEPSTDRTGTDEVTLEIGAAVPGEGWFARLSGEDRTVFVVGDDFLEAVRLPFVARDLFQIDDTDLVQLSLTASDDELLLAKENDQWVARDGRTIDRQGVKRLVADLGGVKTTAALAFDSNNKGIAPHLLTVKSWTAEQLAQNAPSTFRVGRREESSQLAGYRAQLNDLAVTFELPRRLVDELVSFVQKTREGTGDGDPAQ